MRVLIAEDEFFIAAHERCVLEALGHEVVGAARNGREAVRLCESLRPDLLLMDVQMPEMDGLAATRHLMATHPVCVVIVTGKVHFAQAAEEAGAMGYAEKPFAGAMLADVIEKARRRFERLSVRREVTLQYGGAPAA